VKKEHVHRAIWMFMAVLFIVTALGVGVYAFWVNTHNNGNSSDSSYIKCSQPSGNETASEQPKKNGKYEGASVIQGWIAGLPGMKTGGTRRLLIPAQYAYGSQSVAGIPPNSDLVFDITLLSVK
jgi:hypothetical protein